MAGGRPPLGGRDEAEVPLGRGKGLLAAQDAEHGHAERIEGLAQQLLVPVRGDPVEDQPRHADLRVEAGEAVHDCRDRPGHRGAVHDQQHGRPQQLGHLSGRGQLARPGGAVEHAHDALDDRQVRAGGAVGEQRRDHARSRQERIEVAAGPPGGNSVVGRVDEVRTDLEARDPTPALREGRHQASGHGGLAHPGVGPGHHHPGGHRIALGMALTTRFPAGRGCPGRRDA